jgi:hypothetical protein
MVDHATLFIGGHHDAKADHVRLISLHKGQGLGALTRVLNGLEIGRLPDGFLATHTKHGLNLHGLGDPGRKSELDCVHD